VPSGSLTTPHHNPATPLTLSLRQASMFGDNESGIGQYKKEIYHCGLRREIDSMFNSSI